MLNFNWWVNRKDPAGATCSPEDFWVSTTSASSTGSAQLPTGGSLEQADGTAWMAFYCQNMLEIALILTEYDPMYEETAYKFVEHFCGSPTRWTASASIRTRCGMSRTDSSMICCGCPTARRCA
jgi:hypothetical protein